ncbi:hypothetical protein DFO45_4869 [Azorhizobium sp. AG788]|uniref:hypothetical protein n=1 Tax=Azorhizobium sp. AG788 TaxID=2183897 RepID=UPI00105DCD56|nr:hypothetical protein [Azorhizobium sp. AG788]TDT88080.1 hypothetical protein DFO45_4869 [Azorhizobium sp. AG788]
MSKALLDNDVIVKVCRYSLGSETISSIQNLGYAPALLEAARFVVADRLRRQAPVAGHASALLEPFLSGCQTIEPTDSEIEIAAAFEAEAQRLNLELDSGESLLLAILIERQAALLLTGDKRAIRAMEAIAPDEIQGAIACLEQLFVTLNADWGAPIIQTRVCGDQAADAALTNSYACRSGASSAEAVSDGLGSYIEHLRRDCVRILVDSQQLPRRVP